MDLTGAIDFSGYSGLETYSPRREHATGAATHTPLRLHPLWVRMERAILTALTPFVEARLAVAQALADVEPDPESTA
jgi:hypothetical protein